jgi:hypothetical protein
MSGRSDSALRGLDNPEIKIEHLPMKEVSASRVQGESCTARVFRVTGSDGVQYYAKSEDCPKLCQSHNPVWLVNEVIYYVIASRRHETGVRQKDRGQSHIIAQLAFCFGGHWGRTEAITFVGLRIGTF